MSGPRERVLGVIAGGVAWLTGAGPLYTTYAAIAGAITGAAQGATDAAQDAEIERLKEALNRERFSNMEDVLGETEIGDIEIEPEVPKLTLPPEQVQSQCTGLFGTALHACCLQHPSDPLCQGP